MFHKKEWVYLASSLKVTLGNIRGLYIGGVLILPAILALHDLTLDVLGIIPCQPNNCNRSSPHKNSKKTKKRVYLRDTRFKILLVKHHHLVSSREILPPMTITGKANSTCQQSVWKVQIHIVKYTPFACLASTLEE